MTGNISNGDTDKRMERIEKDIAEIKSALLGNVIEGTPGLLGRVRDRERSAENHDLRIVSLETEAKQFARRAELREIEKRVEELEKIRERLIGALIFASAVGAGLGGALVKLFGG